MAPSRRPASFLRLLSLLLVIAAGCLDPGASAPDDRASEASGGVLARAAHYRDFARVTTAAYGSELGDFDIDLWVSGEAAAAYARIDPAVDGSKVQVPVGTIIVREVHDAQGGVAKLTMMAKGPPGYNPDLGDWWFCVADAEGEPLVEDGEVLAGRMPQCWSCHDERGADDFLFGVPAAAKAR
jgi:hypothetical protein